MPTDDLGLSLSGASDDAASHYRAAVDAHLHAWPGAEAALDAALADSPGFALAHGALALLRLARGDAVAARAALEQAQPHAPGCSERERSHLALLAHIVEGRPREALAAVQTHAQQWPTDAFANTTALGAFGLFAFSGRADHDQARLAYVSTLAPHYPADHPWLLTQRAWSHIEAGELAAGRPLIERSLALRRANGNAAHVAMHLHFEAAHPAAALAFADDWLGDYPEHAMLWGHLHWHAALTHLALGDVDAAVDRLHQRIVPHLRVAWPLVGLTDIASLLWRLQLRGRPGLPWQAGSDFAARWYAQGGNPLVSVHLAMLAAARGDDAALEALGVRLRQQATGGQAAAVPACYWTSALIAARAGDATARDSALAACLDNALRLGGSHAQRSVVEETAAAWSAAGRPQAVSARPSAP